MPAQPARNASNGEAELLPRGDYFAVWQLTKILHCNRQRIVALCEEGDLEGAVDIRGVGASRACIRVPRAGVIAYLEQRKVTASNGKRPTKRVRISPTQRHHRDHSPAAALLAWLR